MSVRSKQLGIGKILKYAKCKIKMETEILNYQDRNFTDLFSVGETFKYFFLQM